MTDRADGIHFGTGEDAGSGIFQILSPSAPTIMNEPEAQWHYASVAGRRNGLTVWRSSPDRRPAQDNWDAHVFSRSVFKNIDAHHDRTGVYPTDILLLNELNLDYERGDARGDGGAFDTNPANWPDLYQKLANFLSLLLLECEQRAADRGFKPRWWFPGWAPGHGELDSDNAAIWVPVAQAFDGVVLHAYTDVATITDTVLWYAQTFGSKPLLLGEWNSINFQGDRLTDEAYIRARLRSLCSAFPQLQCCYFIYAWAEDRKHEHDIKGNYGRLQLWNGNVALPSDDWTPPFVVPPAPPKEDTPPVPYNMPEGIDVSNNNGDLDWDAIKAAGVEFMVAKITEATYFRDGWFADNWSEAKRLGIKRGAYHFAQPDQGGPEAQADYFVDAFGLLGASIEPGDILALDLETGSGDLFGWALAFLQRVEQRVGFKPLLYTSPGFAAEHNLENHPELAAFGLWQADWRSTFPNPIPGWDVIAIWQQAVVDSFPGFPGQADVDYFNGEIVQFEKYGMPAPSEKPSEPPVLNEPPAAPSFQFGFADIASRADVGDPLNNEGPFNPAEFTVQLTSKGLMLYHQPTNAAYFLAASR